MSETSDERLKALVGDALGRPAAPKEPLAQGYAPLDSSSHTSECGETTCPPTTTTGRTTWFLVGLAVVAAVTLALLWRELRRHCASGEERLWGCIRVPPAVRVMMMTPKMAAQPLTASRDRDPYFTPIEDDD